MSGEAKNWDFFNKSQNKNQNKSQKEQANIEAGGVTSAGENKKQAEHVYGIQDKQLFALIDETKNILKLNEFQGLANETEKIEKAMQNSRFKVSVVGEFNRGKSTFVNNLFGREILPVGAIPTTAILTKVTHNPKEMIVFVNAKGEKKPLPLAPLSWTGLTADPNGGDAEGVAFVGLDSQWLSESGIEIIDTPGTDDTDEKRALRTNDALLCGDGAIITVSATNPLSLTEEEFIKQRLLFTKTPYLLLILTKLDTVKEQERANVIEYVKGKLTLWNADIPVFIPQDNLDIPGIDFASFTGVEAIKAEITKWANDSDRQKRKKAQICAHMLSVLQIAESSFAVKERLLQLDEGKRKQVFNQKKFQISKIQLQWEELRLEILKRGNKCFEWLQDAVREKQEALVERLQYEAAHSNSPQKWWQEDYPYRLKTEMMNLAASLESGLTQNYTNDVKWLNNTLDKHFKSSIFVEKETFADKSVFKESKSLADVEFENIEKKRMWSRIGMGAITIAGFAAFSAVGLLPIAASVGIGTGGALISEKIFKRKIEDQQQAIKEAIAVDVPRVIDNALVISEKRLRGEYNNLVREMSAQEVLWVKSQLEALQSAETTASSSKSEDIISAKESINNQIKKIENILEG